MWISKKQLGEMFGRELGRLVHELDEWKKLHASTKTRVDRLEIENRELMERLIGAEGSARAAQAMRDLMTIDLNTARDERGQFLQMIVDPTFKPAITVPKIQNSPSVMPPGIDFEDMGDARAHHDSLNDLHPLDPTLKKVEDLTGLVGRVYDPGAELGVHHDLAPEGTTEP